MNLIGRTYGPSLNLSMKSDLLNVDASLAYMVGKHKMFLLMQMETSMKFTFMAAMNFTKVVMTVTSLPQGKKKRSVVLEG